MTQYYRYDTRWRSEDWPFEMDVETMQRLSSVTEHSFRLRSQGDDTVVERYTYVGDAPKRDDIQDVAAAVVGGDE